MTLPAMVERMKSTTWLVIGVLAAFLLTELALVLPDPVSQSALPGEFSANRAMNVVRKLTDIGLRRNGTAGGRRAAEYLAAELGKLPGIEVDIQRVSNVARYGQQGIPFPPFVYRTENVVARLKGVSKSAVLLDAHYDTFTDSVGAGDDAMGAAAVVETLRALSAGPQPRYSIVVNLNGAEEVGMLGAAGFLHHPYAKDVKAYLYVDTSAKGKPVVIGTGPGNRWMLDAFKKKAPTPVVSSLLEGLATSGLLMASGDFVPFHEAGLVGIDIAALDGFGEIHTHLDVPERIDLGTFQFIGDALLEGTRGLLGSDLKGNVQPDRFVYYDVLGCFVVTYSLTAAKTVAALTALLVFAALFLAIKRNLLAPRQILGALGRVTLASVSALISALLAAAVLSFVLKRPHGWYSAPWLGAIAFSLPAVAASLGVLSLKRRNRNACSPSALWAGALLFWMPGLVISALADFGGGYLFLWLTGLGALGLIGSLLKPALRYPIWLATFLPGAALTLEVVATLYSFATAHLGMIPAPSPMDLAVAALIGITLFMLLPTMLIPFAETPRPGRVALIFAVFSVVGIVATALHFPYSADRPKRVQAVVSAWKGGSKLLLAARDAVPLDSALENIPEAAPLKTPRPAARPLDPVPTHGVEAAPPTFEPPRIDVLSSRVDESSDTRVVKLRMVSAGPSLWLYIPKDRLKAWSLGALPEKSIDENRMLVVFENAAEEAKELELTLHGKDPVKLELTEVRGPSAAPEINVLQIKLPNWVALDTLETWVVEKDI